MAGIVVGVWIAYNVVFRDMPEIKQGIRAIQEQMRQAEDRQRAALESHSGLEQAARAKLDSSLKVVQANLIALIQKVEHRQLKADEIRDIMASVQDVSANGATSLHSPTISGDLPKPPTAIPVASAEVREQIRSAFDFKVQGGKPSKFIEAAILAKDSSWEVTGDGILVTYEGGSALFKPKAGASREDLEKQAEILNAMTRAIKLTIVPANGAVPYKSQVKPQPNGGAVRGPRVLPTPERPSPSTPERFGDRPGSITPYAK